MQTQSWTAELIDACKKTTGVMIKNDNYVCVDFGNLTTSTCCDVALPASQQEMQALILFANNHHLMLTLRGKGLSQSGQSIAPTGGMVVDCSLLNKISTIDFNTLSITCEPGATWLDLLAKTSPHGLAPPVIPNNPHLSIGGTLSIGGIGAMSHRESLAINHVTQLEVISGHGEKINCNKENNPDAFHSSVANLGNCNAITSATITLKPFQSNVRTFYLLYDDYTAWIDDQLYLATDDNIAYMEAFCCACQQGLRNSSAGRKPFAEWFYVLHISYEYSDSRHAPTIDSLHQLRHWKHTHTEETLMTDYFNRYQPRFDFMQLSGALHQAHPWLESFISPMKIKKLLPELLNALPLLIGDGHRLQLIRKNNCSNNLFIYPDDNLPYSFLFAALPTNVPTAFVNSVLANLRNVDDMLSNAGGKRYLSGWLEPTNTFWQTHYGEKYSQWIMAKKTMDPNNIFQSILHATIN